MNGFISRIFVLNNSNTRLLMDVVCGVYVIDIRTMTELAQLTFTGDMAQIYDVALADLPFADVLQPDETLVSQIFEFPPLAPVMA